MTQKIVRVSSLAKVLDTIQSALEAGMTEEQAKGARWALDAVRREYGIPIKGEQEREGISSDRPSPLKKSKEGESC